MLVSSLVPEVQIRVDFSYADLHLVPNQPGCYALTAFGDEILYIRQSEDVCNRMKQHLNDQEKRGQTPAGKVCWFYYKLCHVHDLNKLENGWMNEYMSKKGDMPFFNKVRPPA